MVYSVCVDDTKSGTEREENKSQKRGSMYSSLNILSNMKPLHGAAPCTKLMMTDEIQYTFEKL